MCLASEEIVCRERVEVYDNMLQFVIHHNNKRKREDTNVVAEDGILNQERIITRLELPNTICMTDVFHLPDSTSNK